VKRMVSPDLIVMTGVETGGDVPPHITRKSGWTWGDVPPQVVGGRSIDLYATLAVVTPRKLRKSYADRV
jgi:hypothetical protein